MMGLIRISDTFRHDHTIIYDRQKEAGHPQRSKIIAHNKKLTNINLFRGDCRKPLKLFQTMSIPAL